MLTLQQGSYGELSGTLQSNNGSNFTLEGSVSEGMAAGICRMEEGGVFFEAYLDGQDLTLSLIEPDEYNMPDYDRAQYLVFTKSTKQNNPNVQSISPLEQLTRTKEQEQQTIRQDKPAQYASKAETQPSPPSGFAAIPAGYETVSDEINGYAFLKPSGWNHQVSEGYILLGSNTVPGLILTFPHQGRSFQEMLQEMSTGIQEEGIHLTLSSQVQQLSSSMANCYYQGIVQGEQAKAYGIGVLNPKGGGIFILAISTPDKLGSEIESAANSISKHTSFTSPKAGDQDLVRHFSGEWAWSNGYRTEWMMFYPDGSFSDQYEAAYSGNTTDGWGNQTGNWGATNQSTSRGRWSIQGNRDAGVITVISRDGTQTRYEYRVFVENGEKYYREYMFNGYHYQKNKQY
jgi:hypothetical protein